ncbi:DUF6478 family protein [Shimia ponticola]|uniref:DUF6478 family protein n=1 Tax=Shimia ponticola TaxID=2582893 RepID=UPI0011BE5BD3|nr:DUF6478 family protein [Shimia ponticola]
MAIDDHRQKGLSVGVISKFLHKRSLARWSRAARGAKRAPLSRLRATAEQAMQLRHHLDDVIFQAEERLALPRIGSNAIFKPRNSDWSWRPEIWKGPLPRVGLVAVDSQTPVGTQATVFHDCKISELTTRQVRNRREEDLAPYGLRMDVFRFDGSFLSLAINLPDSAVNGLKKRHLIRMNAIVEFEKPLEIFARLNLRHGPNTEQVVRELPLNQEDCWVEFDLAYTKLNEKRVERMWVDLIFEGPEMNQVILRDVTFSRSPRAEL